MLARHGGTLAHGRVAVAHCAAALRLAARARLAVPLTRIFYRRSIVIKLYRPGESSRDSLAVLRCGSPNVTRVHIARHPDWLKKAGKSTSPPGAVQVSETDQACPAEAKGVWSPARHTGLKPLSWRICRLSGRRDVAHKAQGRAIVCEFSRSRLHRGSPFTSDAPPLSKQQRCMS